MAIYQITGERSQAERFVPTQAKPSQLSSGCCGLGIGVAAASNLHEQRTQKDSVHILSLISSWNGISFFSLPTNECPDFSLHQAPFTELCQCQILLWKARIFSDPTLLPLALETLLGSYTNLWLNFILLLPRQHKIECLYFKHFPGNVQGERFLFSWKFNCMLEWSIDHTWTSNFKK